MVINKEDQQQIDEVRLAKNQTRRATVTALEDILLLANPVLDHGFIRVIDYMGDDAAVVQAARVSYGRGTRTRSDDRTLIRYLMRQSHTTPFEMAEIKFHVRLPIFVARQWIRHRTASVNEYSARYSVLDNEFYIPSAENITAQAKDNRQGRGDALQGEEAAAVLRILREDAERNYRNYLWMLNENKESGKFSVARELARINLPLSTYTQWYWKTNLHNLMHFVRLRADSHAQMEIRVYANEILKIMERWVPITTEAFLEYRMNAVTLSSTAVKAIALLLRGEDPTTALNNLSSRERRELSKVFGLQLA